MTTLALGPSWLDPDHLISTFGVIGLLIVIFAESGLLIGFFLPGDSLLFTAGLLVTTGKLGTPLWLLCLLVWFAAALGDQVGFLFGRKVGPSLFNRPDSRLFKQENVEKAHAFFEKHGPKSLVLARFVPIVRTFTPIIAGVSRMEYRSFLIYNVIGGGLWGIGVAVLGAVLGKVAFVHAHIELILVAIVLVSVIPIAIEYLRARRKAAKEGAQSPSAGPEGPRPTAQQPGDPTSTMPMPALSELSEPSADAASERPAPAPAASPQQQPQQRYDSYPQAQQDQRTQQTQQNQGQQQSHGQQQYPGHQQNQGQQQYGYGYGNGAYGHPQGQQNPQQYQQQAPAQQPHPYQQQQYQQQPYGYSQEQQQYQQPYGYPQGQQPQQPQQQGGQYQQPQQPQQYQQPQQAPYQQQYQQSQPEQQPYGYPAQNAQAPGAQAPQQPQYSQRPAHPDAGTEPDGTDPRDQRRY
ncbi:DedA family protein [Streptomyces sp. 8L]|uniref:DedA family protein n=1 Tax=Streptomyces sp. 8L TaxID=2877242 RepID=UPI001CD2F42E|nr:VTT domain-containing protein [Streptomyces sp. 8L]MCA1221267.1 VTT domain-containing protein [Streptomyces sp. 8L]